MNSEYFIKIFKAFKKGNEDQFFQIAWEIIKNEEKKNHHLLSIKLKKILEDDSISSNLNDSKFIPPIPRDNEKGFRLLDVKNFYLNWSDVILEISTRKKIEQIIKELKNEGILKTYGLKNKKKILFYGPPGTGKTLTAKVLSSIIKYPFVFVRFESVISSFLGETASNLRKIFDFITKGKWIVLFDEFDIIGKQRDDPTEHGEIKRVVNNFMLMIENYEGESIIISSTNHPHLLDIGIWRRFDDIIYFDLPNKRRRTMIFDKYLKNFEKDMNINLDEISGKCKGFSGSDIEQVCIETLKQAILDDKKSITSEDLYRSLQNQKDKKRAQKVKKYE